MPSPLSDLTAWVMRRRGRLPGFLRRLPEAVERRPDGLVSRLAYLALGRDRAAPPPTPAVEGSPRVLVGPTNYAGQGDLWARAISRGIPGAAARSLAVAVPGGFVFPADTVVPFTVQRHSSRWQDAEFSAVVTRFDHVLVESMRPLFGSRFGDVGAEIAALRAHGLSVALIAHGTDVRSPRAHAEREPWSPFLEDPRAARLEAAAGRNRVFAETCGLPLFVSTPDLLDDLPRARWCPVVVDAAAWMPGRAPLTGAAVPIVVHAPSAAGIKGSELIEPDLQRLHDRGLIEYRRLTGIPHAEMPGHIRDADIVLDQFRLGTYGVAACEAMAAGRIVVGHVSDRVRDRVAADTGRALPILEADPRSLASVLEGVLADPAPARRSASEGPAFVEEIHSGQRSADVFADAWLARPGASR